MTKPGVKGTIGNDLPIRNTPGSTGTAFVVATADRGPVDEAVPVRSTAQLIDSFGPRVATSPLFDTLDVAFREGLELAYVVRRVGPAAVIASKNLLETGGKNTLEVHATSPGAWGNKIEVEITAGITEGTFHVQVLYEGELVKASPELADNAAAVAWATANAAAYISLKDLGQGDPKPQTVTLTAGADDLTNVDAEVIAEGLELFTADLGSGQVAVPGNTAEAVQEAVIAHCDETWRTPILDGADTADAETLIATAGALRAAPGARQGGIFAPWDVAPGIAPSTQRIVPPCARQLGAIARVDAASGTSNVPAAGEEGKALYVTGVTQTYSDADREALNEAGVNVSIVDEGTPTTYGWRTLADPVLEPTWVPLSSARQVVAIAYGTKKTLKRFVFKPADAQLTTVANAEGAIVNEVLKPAYAAKALFGETEAEALSVAVSQDVNPTDGSVAKLEANLAIRPTKFAEVIELTVTATDRAL